MERIECPHCGKRLFDISPNTSGTISIKCPRCKAVVLIQRAPELTSQRQPSAK